MGGQNKQKSIFGLLHPPLRSSAVIVVGQYKWRETIVYIPVGHKYNSEKLSIMAAFSNSPMTVQLISRHSWADTSKSSEKWEVGSPMETIQEV